MPDVKEGLERRFNLFIGRETPYAFFFGLADYINYVLSIPKLKKVVTDEFAKRDSEYEEIEKLENQSAREMRQAKEKLLGIIKSKKIDPRSFSRDISFIPTVRSLGKEQTILDALEIFEKGEVSISGFYSDNLGRFLFDIAANLLKLGYKDELKDFLVSNNKYEEYDSRINGYELRASYNQNGNFIFSKTLPARYEKVRDVEMAREIEKWGAFELVINFWKALKEVSKNAEMNQIFKDCKEDKEYKFGGKETMDVIYFSEDLNELVKNHGVSDSALKHLHMTEFIPRVSTVHLALTQDEVGKNYINENTTLQRKVIEEKIQEATEEAWHKSVEQFMEETRSSLVELSDAVENRTEHEDDIIGEKWWSDGARPTYDDVNFKIILDGRECPLGQTAFNQQVICEALFKKFFGEPLMKYEIVESLAGKGGKGAAGKRAFQDAIEDINKKAKVKFKIGKIIEHKYCSSAPAVRIRSELFSVKIDEEVSN